MEAGCTDVFSRTGFRWLEIAVTVGVDLLFGDPFMATSLKRFLRRNNVATVFSQYLVAGATVQRVVGSLGLRHVVRGHGYDVSNCIEDAEWRRRYRVLEECAAIVVPTPYQIERLRAIGLKNVPIHAQPCGIEVPSGCSEVRRSRSPVRVVSVGRMVGKKAPLLAMKAFLTAAEESPNLEMTMVGDGPLFDQVQDLRREHPLGTKVTLSGSLPNNDALRLMAEADIFLQHSITDPRTGDQEGAPVAILEAMARSVPVVSTRHSGIPYLVEEGATGLLSDEGDVGAMTANLIKLAKDSDLRRRLGDAGRARAEQFTWERERAVLLELLYDCSTGG